MCDNYKKGIQALLSKGYAEAVPTQDLERNDGGVYYLPHHPIYNIHKKKIRIVFDCSAKYHGSSLNDHILQGPDLTNKLTSVLLRFSKNGIAVVGDVEARYHQVKVPVRDRDALRFIWSKNNELDGELVDYRMTVHLFSGVWSSSAANYSLRRTADENETEETRDAAKSIRSNFYVDDWLFSTDTEEKAIQIQREVSNLLRKGGFKLTKFDKQNPADSLTRGLGSRDLINSNWLSGPEFLSTPENEWQLLAITEDLPSNDPEIKGKQITCVTEARKTFIDDLILRASSFHKLKRRVAWLLKFKEYLILKAQKKQQQQKAEIAIEVLKQAKQEILTHVQRANFPEEYETLRDGKKPVKRSSSLYKLSLLF